MASTAFLQAAAQDVNGVTGVVRDTTGGVLPGVVVEASSPALIGRMRAVATDASGRYRLLELPVGTYAVDFVLPGFAPFRREGLVVNEGVTLTINAELSAGGVDERIVVAGDSPTVDVSSLQRQVNIDDDVVRVLPGSRDYSNVLAGVPAFSVPRGGTAVESRRFWVHGGGRNEGAVQIDGMNVGDSIWGAGTSAFTYDIVNADEIQVTVAGGLGEAERGGPRLNIVPRTGGNQFSGTVFASGAGERFQGSNLTDELRGFGIEEAPKLISNWDANVSVGGPILRDRLWFFGNWRTAGEYRDLPGLYGNANAGDPSRWDYVADRSVKSRVAAARTTGSMRLTLGAGDGQRLGAYVDYQRVCAGSARTVSGEECRSRGDDWVAVQGFASVGRAPEFGWVVDHPEWLAQGTWQLIPTDRLVLEAGVSSISTPIEARPATDGITDLIPVFEFGTSGDVPVANFGYRGWYATPGGDTSHDVWRASALYTPGAHELKAGYQGAYMLLRERYIGNDSNLGYGLFNGTPFQIAATLPGIQKSNRVRYDALYLQDKWTLDRLTLQGALRYEHAWSWYPDGENGNLRSTRFAPEVFTLPGAAVVEGYHDVLPRIGAAYDLFGNGRTALKVSLGKYLRAASNEEAYYFGNPIATMSFEGYRTWVDGNANLTPDCDLLDGGFQNTLFTGGDLCTAWFDPRFGDFSNPIRVNPDVMHGWGVRQYDWQFSAGVQQEVAPRTSLDVTYHRRTWGNFFVTDNLTNSAADWDEFTIISPSHPRLDTSGQPLTYVTISEEKFRLADNYYTFASDYGDVTAYWQGVDVTVNSRLANGLTVQAGTSSGTGVRDTCEITAKLPEMLGADQVGSCRAVDPWLTNFQGLASYVVPGVDVLVSTIFRSRTNHIPPGGGFFRPSEVRDVATNGESHKAFYLVPSADVEAALGRPLAGGNLFQQVDLTRPGQLYGDRENTVDLRLAKVLRFGSTRTDVGFDILNLLNAGTVVSSNWQFGEDGAAWLRPIRVLTPRLVRFNVTVQF